MPIQCLVLPAQDENVFQHIGPVLPLPGDELLNQRRDSRIVGDIKIDGDLRVIRQNHKPSWSYSID